MAQKTPNPNYPVRGVKEPPLIMRRGLEKEPEPQAETDIFGFPIRRPQPWEVDINMTAPESEVTRTVAPLGTGGFDLEGEQLNPLYREELYHFDPNQPQQGQVFTSLRKQKKPTQQAAPVAPATIPVPTTFTPATGVSQAAVTSFGVEGVTPFAVIPQTQTQPSTGIIQFGTTVINPTPPPIHPSTMVPPPIPPPTVGTGSILLVDNSKTWTISYINAHENELFSLCNKVKEIFIPIRKEQEGKKYDDIIIDMNQKINTANENAMKNINSFQKNSVNQKCILFSCYYVMPVHAFIHNFYLVLENWLLAAQNAVVDPNEVVGLINFVFHERHDDLPLFSYLRTSALAPFSSNYLGKLLNDLRDMAQQEEQEFLFSDWQALIYQVLPYWHWLGFSINPYIEMNNTIRGDRNMLISKLYEVYNYLKPLSNDPFIQQQYTFLAQLFFPWIQFNEAQQNQQFITNIISLLMTIKTFTIGRKLNNIKRSSYNPFINAVLLQMAGLQLQCGSLNQRDQLCRILSQFSENIQIFSASRNTQPGDFLLALDQFMMNGSNSFSNEGTPRFILELTDYQKASKIPKIYLSLDTETTGTTGRVQQPPITTTPIGGGEGTTTTSEGKNGMAILVLPSEIVNEDSDVTDYLRDKSLVPEFGRRLPILYSNLRTEPHYFQIIYERTAQVSSPAIQTS